LLVLARADGAGVDLPRLEPLVVADGEQLRALRLVEREVGLVEEGAPSLGLRRLGDPDRERPPAGALVRRALDRVRDRQRVPAAAARQDGHELVPARPVDPALRPDLLLDGAGDGPDVRVPGL